MPPTSARRASPAARPAPRATRLVVVGSSNTDFVILCHRLPAPGETVSGGAFHRFAGGKGANQAVAAARAGARVTFIGARGDDDLGAAAARGLRREGIDIRHFRPLPDAPSGVALICVGGADRQNQIAVARSANDRLTAAHVAEAQDVFRPGIVVVAQLEVPQPAVKAAATLTRRAGGLFVLNPGPPRDLPRSFYRLIDLITPNETEAHALTGQSDPERAARAFLAWGCPRVVITLGGDGALLADASGLRRIPARKVRPVDTVGAGDCFTAWLAVGLAEGLSLDDAAHRATRAAALAVTRPGAQPGMPHRRELP